MPCHLSYMPPSGFHHLYRQKGGGRGAASVQRFELAENGEEDFGPWLPHSRRLPTRRSLLSTHDSVSSDPSASICVCQSNSRTAIGFSRQCSATFTNKPR